MHPKELITKTLKAIGVDTRQAIIGVIVVSLVGGYSGLLYLSKTALEISLLFLNTQTPLWATISLIVLCCLYIYLQIVKIPATLNQEGQSSGTTSIKYCECCPVNERQPLIRTGGTSKRSYYICPNTKQSYSIPHVLE